MCAAVTTGPASHGERIFLQLVADYQTAILNYLYRLVGNFDVAEDLTQDTFMKAFRSLDRLNLEAEAAPQRRAWLYRIAHNTAADHLRRRARLRWLSLDAVRERSGDDPTAYIERGEPVLQALGALSGEHRDVLVLFGYAELSADEVAAVLGITPEAARKRRQRAREAFASQLTRLGLLTEEGGGEPVPGV